MLSMEDDAVTQRQKAGFWTATGVITERFVRKWLRDPDMFASEVSQYLFYGIFLGLLYLNVSDDVSVRKPSQLSRFCADNELNHRRMMEALIELPVFSF